jgi:hypothetical protein
LKQFCLALLGLGSGLVLRRIISIRCSFDFFSKQRAASTSNFASSRAASILAAGELLTDTGWDYDASVDLGFVDVLVDRFNRCSVETASRAQRID